MQSLRSRLFRLVVKYFMAPKFDVGTTVHEQRNALEGFAKLSILPRKTKIESLQVGGLEAKWISVGSIKNDSAVLYLHGGAYNIGSLNTHRDLAARISKAGNVRVLLINYRLAPEHAYPAALEDVAMAYSWLLKNEYSPQDIVIAGEYSFLSNQL